MTLDEANLNQASAALAQRLIDAGGTLISGRRTIEQQASAMAARVVQNRNWIHDTYRKPLCIAAVACQEYVDLNWTASLAAADQKEFLQNGLEASLLVVQQSDGDEAMQHLSWHLSGDAVDFLPVFTEGEPLSMTLRAIAMQAIADREVAGGSGEILTEEGGQPAFHVQIR